MTDPAGLAFKTIREVMAEGAKKPRPADWRQEDIRMHVLKAQRHLATFLLILDGHQEPDDENHLANALTRCSMALTQEVDK